MNTEIFNKKFSEIAHSAFDTRQDSDYEDFYKPSKDEAKIRIDEAIIFFNEVEKKRNSIINKELKLNDLQIGISN